MTISSIAVEIKIKLALKRFNLDSKEGSALIDQAIEVFDGLIARVNDKKADNRSAHLKSVKNKLNSHG